MSNLDTAKLEEILTYYEDCRSSKLYDIVRIMVDQYRESNIFDGEYYGFCYKGMVFYFLTDGYHFTMGYYYTRGYGEASIYHFSVEKSYRWDLYTSLERLFDVIAVLLENNNLSKLEDYDEGDNTFEEIEIILSECMKNTLEDERTYNLLGKLVDIQTYNSVKKLLQEKNISELFPFIEKNNKLLFFADYEH